MEERDCQKCIWGTWVPDSRGILLLLRLRFLCNNVTIEPGGHYMLCCPFWAGGFLTGTPHCWCSAIVHLQALDTIPVLKKFRLQKEQLQAIEKSTSLGPRSRVPCVSSSLSLVSGEFHISKWPFRYWCWLRKTGKNKQMARISFLFSFCWWYSCRSQGL